MWVVWLPYWTVRTNGPHCGRRTTDYTSSGCINTAVLIQPGFPDSSVGKYSTCNARDPGSIPGSGRSPGEGIGYPLQYSLASLVAQLVKNPLTMWETWVWFLGWENPLKKGKATHSSILAWRIPWTVRSMGSQSQTQLTFTFTLTI